MALNWIRVINDVSCCCWFNSKLTQNEILRQAWIWRIWRNKESLILLKYWLGKSQKFQTSFRAAFKKLNWTRWIIALKRIASVIDWSFDGIATWKSATVTSKLCSLWSPYCLNTWIFKIWFIKTLKEAQ